MIQYNYYEAKGMNYPGLLKRIKKSKNYLQPIYEAFTNSLEAIKMCNGCKREITISLNFKGTLFSNDNDVKNLQSISIIDTGIGFTDKGFDRLKNIYDESKGFANKGSGRLQFIHYFDVAIYESVYKNNQEKKDFLKRYFKLSKSKRYLEQHSILVYKNPSIEKDKKNSYTKLELKTLLDDDDKRLYSELTPTILKQEILHRYLEYFAANRETLPTITIKTDSSSEIETITANDIVEVNKEEIIEINYKMFNGTDFIKVENSEKFIIKSFVINQSMLSENSLKLTSKQEIIINKNIVENVSLDVLKPKESIDSNRYLFLVSGEYIDKKDSDNRGELELYTEEEAKKTLNKDQELILLDDINNHVNSKILSMYEEIRDKKKKHEENLDKLRKMFLLNEKTIQNAKININDTDESILKKVYKADVAIIAEKDAEIKEKIDQLDTLDLTNSEQNNYQNKLNQHIEELVQVIPLQNRTALTHAVARRKLVLDLFDKVLNRTLTIQNNGGRNIDEELLHNLIFPKHSVDSNTSDMWILNEDYIYFKGASEGSLGTIMLNNETIFKEKLTLEEEQYKLKQEGDAGLNRTDILLFPKESKCIIIEFKTPNVNISNHLTQINRYASLINNLSKDKYKFNTFYGYLIGENIDVDDIVDNDSDFKDAEGLNFIFRPYKRIVGKFNRKDGALYTEIIKYSTLLERAKLRNKHYIDKLLGKNDD